MKILVTGASGFIGSSLVQYLNELGHQVVKLVRRHNDLTSSEIYWNPDQEGVAPNALEGIDAVVHLAGENLAGGRWTEERKKRILESRVKGTKLLCKALAHMKNPPKVLISASAVGFYGDQGTSILTENATQGHGFLSDVCQKWESATHEAVEKGIRVINLRMGVVLSPKGGALKMMLMPFKWGMGGKVGSGQQYMSWIALDDVLAIVPFVIQQASLMGPVNTVSPNPVTNEQFTTLLGETLHRPTVLTIPQFALHGLLGEAADEVLLASTRVQPEKLLQAGYKFLYPTLESYMTSIKDRL